MHPFVRFVAALIAVACLYSGLIHGQEPCPEVGPLENADGPPSVVCPCFEAREEAGVVFELPAEEYPIEILRVGIAWTTQLGGQGQSAERLIRIYDGGLPDPGDPIFQLPGPVLTLGVINEFDLEPLPGEITIDSGPFLVSLQFQDRNAGQVFAPSVVHDGNGCQPGKNAVFATPGGWNDACALGLTGDWSFHVVYRSLDCGEKRYEFIRGDANLDGALDISDPTFGLGVLFLGESTRCLEAMDSNGDEAHDLSDPVYSLNFLFQGGPAPPSPYPGCGSDTGSQDLGCEMLPAACN